MLEKILVTCDDNTFRKNEEIPEVFPSIKIFIMKSDVKNNILIFYRSRPFFGNSSVV